MRTQTISLQKRAIALFFCAVLIALCSVFAARSAYADELVSMSWDADTQTLTIDAEGDNYYANYSAFQNDVKAKCGAMTAVKSVVVKGDGSFPFLQSMFLNFTNLESIYASDGNVPSVGKAAFYLCTSLTTLELGESVTSFSSIALYNGNQITVLDLSQTCITSFGNDGSTGRLAVETLKFPSTLTRIESTATSRALQNWTALKEIDWGGAKLDYIEADAFHGCSSLETFAFPAVVKELGGAPFTDHCPSKIWMPFDLDLTDDGLATQTHPDEIILFCAPSREAQNESLMAWIEAKGYDDLVVVSNELHEVDSDLKCTKCEGQLDLVADPLVADDSVYAAFEQSAGNNHINGAYKMSLTDEEGNTIEEVDVAEGSSLSISLDVEGIDNGTNVRLLQYSSDGTVSSVSDEPFRVEDGKVSFETNSLASAYAVVLMGSAEDGSLTVTFDANGGQFADGDETTEVSVLYDGMVAKPADDPTRENYNFTGWFTDKECTIEYSFDSPVESDMTLYAGWKEVEADDPTDPANPDDSEDSTDPTDSTGDQDATTNDQDTTTDNESASTSSSGTSQTTALSKAGDDSALGFGLAGFFAALASLGGAFAYRKCRAR